MTWSSRATVRGRVEAGVQAVRASSSRWQLEELALLELPPSDGAFDAAQPVAVEALPSAQERAAREEEIREQAAAEAYARGRADGAAEGHATARAELAEPLAALDDLVTQLRDQESRLLQHLEENLAALAVGVARHVIGREVRQDATVVAELVRRALAEFPMEQPVRVRVHPLDLSALTMATSPEGTPIEVAPTRDLSWLADPRVQRGGAVLEGRERIVDGRVDVALERLFRKLGGVTT
jgi:flagellar biosynthesis/type III secretory pathway protein FliH